MNEIILKLKENIKKVIVGKDEVIELVLAGMFSGGHILLEDVPGTGKTQLSKAVAKSVGGDYKRIQFTPDLLPSDVCGVNYFDRKTSEFVFKQGAVFTNVLLADEINRATPRTQSSLLECMEEKQVSVDGVTYKLDEPFFVLATQNPVETAGTFPLPEAQLDRFMLKLSIGYPDNEAERTIIDTYIAENPQQHLQAVCSCEDIVETREKIKDVFMHDSIKQYILDIAQRTRESREIEMGISTRGVIAMVNVARAYAFVSGRDYVTADDVYYLAKYVFAHRIKTGFDSEVDSTDVIKKVLSEINAPTENWEK